MDTPQKFVQDVIEADMDYAEGLNGDILSGILLLDYHTPERVQRVIKGQLDDYIDRALSSLRPSFNKLMDFVANAEQEKCVPTDIKVYLEYFTNAEIPFAISFIKDTDVSKYTTLPEGLDEYLEMLKSKPVCA